jgi:outer membrane lipoprotein-sorting protein
VDGVDFAHAVTLDVAAGGTRAEITLKDVQLNPALSPDIFRLRAPQPPAAAAKPGG